MKTTKQIYLLMEKKGSELAALAEGLDKIIVTEETLRTMFDGKETDSVNASPILEKGVSVQIGDEIKDYLIFEVMERKGDSFKIRILSGILWKRKKLSESTPLWAYTADISVSFGEEISISAESFDNAFVSVYRKQKLYICGEKPRCLRRDESRINKVKRIFFLYCPEKKGLFFRMKIFPFKNMVSCVKDQ